MERLAEIGARARARNYMPRERAWTDRYRGLIKAGISGALVATALHDGRITAAGLASIEGDPAARRK